MRVSTYIKIIARMLISLGSWLVGSRRWRYGDSASYQLDVGHWCGEVVVGRCYLGCPPQVFGISVRWPLGCVIFWGKPFHLVITGLVDVSLVDIGDYLSVGFSGFAALYVSSGFRLFLWRWTSSTSGGQSILQSICLIPLPPILLCLSVQQS